MSDKNKYPKAMASTRSFTARSQTSAINFSYCSFEHGHGNGTIHNGSCVAFACASNTERRVPCMATRWNSEFNVVSSPTNSTSGRRRSRCSAQALSFPLLHDKSTRFMERSYRIESNAVEPVNTAQNHWHSVLADGTLRRLQAGNPLAR